MLHIIMSGISNMETAVLGLLYEHHHYAHRLQEIMEKRAMQNWADLEYSETLKVLKELEGKDLVRSNEDELKIYYITDKGKSALKDKIKVLLSKKDAFIHSIYLGIANIDFLSRDEVIQSLKMYEGSIEERINFIGNSIKIQKENQVPYNFIAILSHSKALLEAERIWINDFTQKIREMK